MGDAMGAAGRGALTLAAVAGGAALGALAERVWSHRRLSESPVPADPVIPHGTEIRRIHSAGGGILHAEIDTPAGWAPGDPTVVLVHGFALDLSTWQHQRRALREVGRVIVYDHRGHGRSAGAYDPGSGVDIERLGSDLAEVIEACAPHSEMVLAGHSMGGMTIMELALQQPNWFGTRVRGSALLATSAGPIATVTLGLPKPLARVAHRLAPTVENLVEQDWLAGVVTRIRGSGSDVSRILTRTYAFGDTAPEHGTALVAHLLGSTPLPVVGNLLADIGRHDRRHALEVLERVPVLIIVGTDDRLTPAGHSRRIHQVIDSSELILLEGVGHMLTLEDPEPIDDALVGFIRQVFGPSSKAIA